MAFHIYNSKGFRIPYNPGEKWRQVEQVAEALPFDERQQDQSRDQEEEDQGQNSFKIKRAKIIPIVASQIMSYPVTALLPDALLKEAWELFDKKRFRHIPIVSTDGKIIGLLSDRIMLHETTEFIEHPLEEDRPVSEVMATNVLCAEMDTNVTQIAKVFIDEHIGAMPITDQHDRLKGMITSSDILRTILKISPPDFRG